MHIDPARLASRAWPDTLRPANLRAELPGLAACVVGAVAAWGLAKAAGAVVPALSPLLVAILLGVAAANLLPLPSWLGPGIGRCSKTVLRAGVVLLGLSVPLSQVLSLGWGAIGVAVLAVATGLAVAALTGPRMGLTREQALLNGGGCSICGAAAVAAVDGTLRRARPHESATAVAAVVVYGTAMIAVAPALASWLGLDDRGAGILIGAGVHEVAQVVAVGGIVGGGALAVAVLVKLTRVLMLAPVMALLGAVERRRSRDDARGPGGPGDDATHLPPVMPLFVAGFIAAVALRATGVVPDGVVAGADQVRTWLFLVAMVALGTGVRRDTLKAAGAGPFLHAGVVTVCVVAVAAAGAALL
ncbi:YeiH family protein [Corynebacterium sp. 335C]